MPLVRVTAALVLEYIDRRQRETAKDITIKDELGHLGQTLKLARHVGTFHEQLDRIFPPFFSAKHKPKSRWPTPAEMAALVPHLEEHRAAQIVYILATGCRREESFRARRQDTQWSRRLVHVHGTKTEASYDDVPITAVTELLLQWSLERAPGRDRLFRPWGNLSRDLAAACVRACIPRLTPNDLRRGFAKWHVLAGVSQNATSKLLRHTTDKLAQTTYARVTGQEVAALVGPQIRALPDLRFLGFEPAGSPACAPPAGSPVALPPATPIAALGALPAAPLPTFTGVPILYRATDQTTPSVPNALHQTPGKQAPPREFESLTFALGKRCSIQLSYGGQSKQSRNLSLYSSTRSFRSSRLPRPQEAYCYRISALPRHNPTQHPPPPDPPRPLDQRPVALPRPPGTSSSRSARTLPGRRAASDSRCSR